MEDAPRVPYSKYDTSPSRVLIEGAVHGSFVLLWCGCFLLRSLRQL